VVEILEYIDRTGRSPFERWFARLRDEAAQAAVLIRLRRLALGLAGDTKGTAAPDCAPRKGKTLMPTRKFETTDYLRTDRQIAAYLDAALTDGDPRVLLQAVRDVAAVRGGMAALARRAGIPRESLYRMLSSRGNPSYVAVRSILGAVGFRLSVAPGIKRPGRTTRAA
jgi:probable addiction module antidote protein